MGLQARIESMQCSASVKPDTARPAFGSVSADGSVKADAPLGKVRQGRGLGCLVVAVARQLGALAKGLFAPCGDEFALD